MTSGQATRRPGPIQAAAFRNSVADGQTAAPRVGRRAALLGAPATLASLAACSPASLLDATVSGQGYRLAADLPYGEGARRRLDVYAPARPAPARGTVVFFYGGAWQSGRKEDYRFVAQALAAAGVAVVVPDYRLHPEVRFPAFVEDGAAALRWVQDEGARFGADPASLVLMGHSAGAHIAALLAADQRFLAAAGVARGRIAGLVGLSGPYDFLPLRSARLRAVFPEETRAQSQPLAFVAPGVPPALFATGDADTTVEPSNTRRLAASWRAAGAETVERIYPGVGHVATVAAFSSLLRASAPSLADTLAFLRRS